MKITDIVDSIIEKTNTNTTDIATIETNKLDTTLVHNATSKTTPVNADELALLDSESSFSLKKLTWSNVKANLSNVFQAVLISGTNIKTINSTSLLGSGNIAISETAWVANDSRAKTALNAGGTAPIYACRTYLTYNGITNTIEKGGNISSVTDNSTGVYTANLIIGVDTSLASISGTNRGLGNRNSDSKITSDTTVKLTTSSGATMVDELISFIIIG